MLSESEALADSEELSESRLCESTLVLSLAIDSEADADNEALSDILWETD